MSTWEDRMAQRSAAKDRARQPADDEHAGHHLHLIGTTVQCSCGQDFGVTCVAFPEELWKMTLEQVHEWFGSLSCSACGEKGVTGPLGS
jgi:hypothetical protein